MITLSVHSDQIWSLYNRCTRNLLLSELRALHRLLPNRSSKTYSRVLSFSTVLVPGSRSFVGTQTVLSDVHNLSTHHLRAYWRMNTYGKDWDSLGRISSAYYRKIPITYSISLWPTSLFSKLPAIEQLNNLILRRSLVILRLIRVSCHLPVPHRSQ